MIALAVDDEKYALIALCDAIREADSEGHLELHSFSTCSDTLAFAAENRVDIAFLDINMRGMGGLELSKRLREKAPDCRIIFCTAHPDYALDAFAVHADGYLLKPITADAVRTELRRMPEGLPKGGTQTAALLTVHCFGSFEVLAGGKPLPFKRSKTKELFALLTDHRGDGMTSKEICAELFEDDGYGDEKNMAYLWNLMSDLKKTLRDAGAEGVLLHPGNSYALNGALLDCDYYRYLDGEKELFRGEYMSRYSWAEATLAKLL